MAQERALKLPEVRQIVGFSNVTLLKLEREGLFPKRRKPYPTAKAVFWLESEITEWLQSCPTAGGGE